MDTTQLKHIKAQCICDLRTYLREPIVRAELDAVDSRLWQYVTDATSPLEHYVLPIPPSDSAQDDEGTEVEDCIASLHELLVQTQTAEGKRITTARFFLIKKNKKRWKDIQERTL